MKTSPLDQGATREDIVRIAEPLLPKFYKPLLEKDRILIDRGVLRTATECIKSMKRRA